MPTFDADAYRAAREPFAVVVNKRRRVARPVSAEIVIALQPALASTDGAVANRALRKLFRAAFPWRLAYWWLGDPVRQILELDPVTRKRLVLDFFGYLGGTSAPLPPVTGGTR